MTKEASDSAKRSSSESKSSKDESGFGAFGAFSALGSGPGKAMDFAKKLLTVGMGTAFLTEEALRALVTEFKIPKELIGGLLESATTALHR